MGMYDSVNVMCTCGDMVEFQSKAGDCVLDTFYTRHVPIEIALDIIDDVGYCLGCGKDVSIQIKPLYRQTVELEVI